MLSFCLKWIHEKRLAILSKFEEVVGEVSFVAVPKSMVELTFSIHLAFKPLSFVVILLSMTFASVNWPPKHSDTVKFAFDEVALVFTAIRIDVVTIAMNLVTLPFSSILAGNSFRTLAEQLNTKAVSHSLLILASELINLFLSGAITALWYQVVQRVPELSSLRVEPLELAVVHAACVVHLDADEA